MTNTKQNEATCEATACDTATEAACDVCNVPTCEAHLRHVLIADGKGIVSDDVTCDDCLSKVKRNALVFCYPLGWRKQQIAHLLVNDVHDVLSQERYDDDEGASSAACLCDGSGIVKTRGLPGFALCPSKNDCKVTS